jgi:hypothetical protein
MRLALDRAGFDKTPADSGIWYPGKNVKKVLFSIDAGTPEILLAKEMGYDLLIAHHPVGPARIAFSEVVARHLDFMLEEGVPRKVAEGAVEELVTRIDVRAHPTNYLHEVDVARKVRLPFINIHLPIDQITRDYLLGAIKKEKSKAVGDLIRRLGRITEFAEAETRIELRMDKDDNPLGRWVLLFAAGTNGGYPVAKAYFENGIDTVIYLHIDYDELLRLRKDCKGNLIVLGHMAGDSIGINIFLKDLASRGVRSDTIGVVR